MFYLADPLVNILKRGSQGHVERDDLIIEIDIGFGLYTQLGHIIEGKAYLSQHKFSSSGPF